MGLQAFERRLERLVEGVFTKAFRSGLQPLEIGRRLVKELDAGRTVGVHGVVAPNHFTVVLSPADYERFATFRDALASELADAVPLEPPLSSRDCQPRRRLMASPIAVTTVANGTMQRC